MSYAARTAELRNPNASGGMASSMAANMVGSQYQAPSGGMGGSLEANLGYRQYNPRRSTMGYAPGRSIPTSMQDTLGPDGLWYAPSIAPSGQLVARGDTTQQPTTAAVVGDALHQTATVITEIINQGSETQRQQLHDAALVRIAEINAAAGQGSPETQAANAAALQALQAAVTATSAAMARQQAPAAEPGLSKNMMIGAAVVTVVVLGGIAFMLSSRKNPSCGPNCGCDKCRPNPVIGSGRSRHFVPMHELERRARKRARRRAAK